MYKRTFLSAVILCTILGSTNNIVATKDKETRKQTSQQALVAAKPQNPQAQPAITRTDKEVLAMLVTAAAIGALFAVTQTQPT